MPETVEAPPAQPEKPKILDPTGKPSSDQPAEKKSLGRRIAEHPIKLGIFILILIALAIAGPRYWTYINSYEDTDDAQIDGDIYAVTSRIGGVIKDVYVTDNQQVEAGQLLVDLDPRDYDVAVDQAKTSLGESQSLVAVARPNVPITSVSTETTVSTSTVDIAAAKASVAGAQRDYQSAVADARKAEADNVKTQADLERYKMLVDKDEVSKQQYDQAVAAANSAAANLEAKKATAEALQQTIDEQQARLQSAQTKQQEAERNRPQQIAIQNAQVQSRVATAQHQQTLLDQALLNLSYTKIYAPVDGVIGKKNAEPGQQVSPGQQLMADVPVGDIWVTANFKETQLERVRPGQRATFHVDSYNRDYEGDVESVAGASGARFSLLPPENATGNYVKVVQRLPIRIRIKPGQDPDHLLRPGMSVEPKVWIK